MKKIMIFIGLLFFACLLFVVVKRGIFYQISDENIAIKSSEHIEKTSRSGFSEFENAENLFETIESYSFHNRLEEFEKEITYTDPKERSMIWGDFETYYYPTSLPQEYELYEVIVGESAVGFLYLPEEVAKGGDVSIDRERDYYLFVMAMGNTEESWLFSPAGNWEYFSSKEHLGEKYEIEEVFVEDLKYEGNPDCGWEPY